MKIFRKISLAVLSLVASAPLAVADVAEKSAAMTEKDPHGFIMAITSICVVFAVLTILWFIYAGVGKMFSGNFSMKGLFKFRKSSGKMTPEVAAAIALALQKENGAEVEAAIALALHQYMNDTAHDNESFVITIRPTFGPYASRQFGMRQLPK